jgi:transcriptional regulator with PAS, ATPase and Fis domain
METLDQTWPRRSETSAQLATPGIVLVFTSGQPQLAALPVGATPLLLGRGRVGDLLLDDACMSRRHAEIAHDGSRWLIRDLGSRNGTAVDGVPLKGEMHSDGARLLRVGDTLFLLCPDLSLFHDATVERSAGLVAGPRLQRVWAQIAGAAKAGDTLHINGETGAGKELAARHFHKSSEARGAFVAINCATIPPALSERLLFGTRKGAYSGADVDAEGHVQAAHQGTLFLDEIAEIDVAVQSKLLRTLETREVVPLGASRPKRVELRLVSATHADLRQRISEGRFREDLFFRIGRPVVHIPPLRERLEEIPWLIAPALALVGLEPHVSLVEAALLRHWPGNVRELLREIGDAGRVAGSEGKSVVEAAQLSPTAGKPIPAAPRPAPGSDDGAAAAPAEPAAAGANERGPRRMRARAPSREAIEWVLRQQDYNVARAARALGVHRTQLYRWLDYLQIKMPRE